MKATGTVRKNRINFQHKFEKKSPRCSYKVHYDKNSGLNFISVIDSKEVSVLSTAAGVTLAISMKRYSGEAGGKVEIEFPLAIKIYNKFMGGVDLHDYRCKRAAPSINSKKMDLVSFY